MISYVDAPSTPYNEKRSPSLNVTTSRYHPPGMVSREPEEPPTEDRLRRLANLQAMLLRHALSFPAVRRVVYSTCSVTEQENEQVRQRASLRLAGRQGMVLWG